MIRIVSWNLHLRVGSAAVRQAELMRGLRPDLALLQETNANSLHRLVEQAGLDWVLTNDNESGKEGRERYLAAISGRVGTSAKILPGLAVPFPGRMASASVRLMGQDFVATSYHAPPGESWGILKVNQAVTYAHWLAGLSAPVVLGADANTPEVDALDFEMTRTHWHTGKKRLGGGPGDDILWGPRKIHTLSDALRRWLSEHPGELEAIREQRPHGPLQISHRTGVRKGHPGFARRFDSIWVTDQFRVVNVQYLYEEALAAGSDHAVVSADLEWASAEADTAEPVATSAPLGTP